jgi:Arrestin (or S-antigen), C-terminal domain
LDVTSSANISSEKCFTVLRLEDLNDYPELRLLNEIEEVKTFYCLFCKSDPVMLRVSTQSSGYSVGGKVTIEIEIFNRSSIHFLKSIISLNRVETYYSDAPSKKTKTHVTPITALTAEGVEAGKNANFSESLHIPLNAVLSNDRILQIYQISYELKVSLKPSTNTLSAVEVTLPIYVGNIGFRETSTAFEASSDFTSIAIEGDFRNNNKIRKMLILNCFFFIYSTILQKCGKCFNSTPTAF